jgi:hypothetical protein
MSISSEIPSVAPCAARVVRKLLQFLAFRFEDILRNLPTNGNAAVFPIQAVQRFDLVLFGDVTCDQHRRKKSGKQNPAVINAINLL